MSATSLHTERQAESLALKAAVLYDAYDSGCRAKVFFDQLTALLGGEMQFSLALWRMDMLQLPGGFDAALRDFGGAELLVLAPRADRAQPASGMEWVESWAVGHTHGNAALVVLTGRLLAASDEFDPLTQNVRALQSLAERLTIGFFCDWTTELGRQLRTFVDHPRRREPEVTTTLRSLIAPDEGSPYPYDHWGLNE
jgi:hypothetical protein